MASGNGGAATAVGGLKGTADEGYRGAVCVKREAGEAPPVFHRTRFLPSTKEDHREFGPEVQRKLAEGAATLRDRRERLEAKRLEQR